MGEEYQEHFPARKRWLQISGCNPAIKSEAPVCRASPQAGRAADSQRRGADFPR
jgi:hypothetical protein